MQSLLQNVLPIVFVTIFLALAPVIILEISKQELPTSHSALEGKVFRRYYHFLIFNVLFVFMIGTTILKSIISVIQQPTNIFTLLAESLPLGSTFFIFYIVFNTCGHALELIQVWAQLFIHGFVTSLKLTPTPRSLQRAIAPWNFQYHYYYPHNILVIVITFIYSTISPLILFASVFYFAFAVLVFKYQLAYCYVRKFESSGKFFRHVFQYTTDGLIIFQITMAGELWLKNAPIAGFIVVTLIGFTIYFKILCTDLFKSRTKFLPLDTGLRNLDNSSTYTLNDIPRVNNDITSAFSSSIMKQGQGQGQTLRHRNMGDLDTGSIHSDTSSDDSELISPTDNGIFLTPTIDIQAASPVIGGDNERPRFDDTANSSPKSSSATTFNEDDQLGREISGNRSSQGSTATRFDYGLLDDSKSAKGGSSRSSVASNLHSKDNIESSLKSRHSSTLDIKLFTVGDNPLDGPQGYDESKILGIKSGGVSQTEAFPRGSVFYLDSEYTQNPVVVQCASHFEHAPSKIAYQDRTSNFETYVHPALLKPLNRKLWLPRNPLYMYWDIDDTVEVDFVLNSSASSNKLELRNRDKDEHHQNHQTPRVSSEQGRQKNTQRKSTVKSSTDNGDSISYHSNGVRHVPSINTKEHTSGIDSLLFDQNDEAISQYDRADHDDHPSSLYLSSKNNSRTQLGDHIVMGDQKDTKIADAVHSGSMASIHKFMPSSPPAGKLLSPTLLSDSPGNTRCKRSASMPPAPPTAADLARIQGGVKGNNHTIAVPSSVSNPRHPFISAAATIRSNSSGYQTQNSGSSGHSPRIAFTKDSASLLNVRSTMFARARGHRHTISNGQGNSIHQGPPSHFNFSRDDTHLGFIASSPNTNINNGGAMSCNSPTTSAPGTPPAAQSRTGAVLQTAGAFFSMIFGDGDDNILEANENPRFGYETGGMWSSRRGNSGRNDDFDDDDDDDDEEEDTDSSLSEEITVMDEAHYTTINIIDIDNSRETSSLGEAPNDGVAKEAETQQINQDLPGSSVVKSAKM
ncbi:CSC1-like protein erd4 [Entomortierella beljakovae]|nr:CSC1-like protein erd4 [Entomortierella beljakovae]